MLRTGFLRGEGAFGQSNSTVSYSLTAFGAGDMIQAMPQFGWNSSEQKITLAVSEKMAGNGINFYVSEGLRKMLDLDNGRVFPGIIETATVGFQGSNYTISDPPVYEHCIGKLHIAGSPYRSICGDAERVHRESKHRLCSRVSVRTPDFV